MKTIFGVPVPRGVQKDWTAHDKARTSSFASILPKHGVPAWWGDPRRCVVWRDRFGRARVIVSHHKNGRSALVRIDANGVWKTTFGQVAAPVGRSGEAIETRSGSTEGEHAVPAKQEGAQAQSEPTNE